MTTSDVQNVAIDLLSCKLEHEELSRVVSRVIDRIELRDPLERAIPWETDKKTPPQSARLLH